MHTYKRSGVIAAMALLATALVPAASAQAAEPSPCGDGVLRIKFTRWETVEKINTVRYWGRAQNCYTSTKRVKFHWVSMQAIAEGWTPCYSVAPGNRKTLDSTLSYYDQVRVC